MSASYAIAWRSSATESCCSKALLPKPSKRSAAASGASWSPTKASSPTLEAQLQIVSVQLLGGAHEVRVYSETDPGSGFRPVDANLEDVYFLNMERHTASQKVN